MVMALLAAAGCAATMAACGEAFSGEEPGAADAGADTSVGGEARGDVDLAVPKGLLLVHGQSLVVDVAVTRKPPFTKGMTITPRGLPAGLAAPPVDITPNDVSAKLTLTVSASVAQGALTGVTFEATSEGALIGKTAVDGFVRGAPGELDTTFGNSGQVDLGTDFNGLAMRADGSFYVLESLNQSAVRRYSKDGALDTTFGTAGVYTPGAATPMTAIAWKDPYLFVAGSTGVAPLKWYVRRLTADGKVDAAYGAGGTYERTSAAAPNQLRGLAIGPNGEALLAGGIGFLGTLVPVTPQGTGIGQTEWNPPQVLSAALFDGARSVAIGDLGAVTRAISSNQMFDGDFADNGMMSTYTGASLVSLVADGPGKYVIGGLDTATQQLFVERVDAPQVGKAKMDLTFNDVGYLLSGITTSAGGGNIALAADRKILQTGTVSVGPAYRCVLVRYTTSGKLDATFGKDGSSTPAIDECYAGQVATQPDGRIVMSGRRLLRFWP
jgi:uncharacterized delta-60 repeat protein